MDPLESFPQAPGTYRVVLRHPSQVLNFELRATVTIDPVVFVQGPKMADSYIRFYMKQAGIVRWLEKIE